MALQVRNECFGQRNLGDREVAGPEQPNIHPPHRSSRHATASSPSCGEENGIAGHLMFVVRRLTRQDRQFALFACGIMALGLWAATFIFGVANALLLRPLPYKDADHLLRIAASHAESRRLNRGLSWASYETVRTLPAIEEAAAYEARGLNITIGSEPRRVAGPRRPRRSSTFLTSPLSQGGSSLPRNPCVGEGRRAGRSGPLGKVCGVEEAGQARKVPSVAQAGRGASARFRANATTAQSAHPHSAARYRCGRVCVPLRHVRDSSVDQLHSHDEIERDHRGRSLLSVGNCGVRDSSSHPSDGRSMGAGTGVGRGATRIRRGGDRACALANLVTVPARLWLGSRCSQLLFGCVRGSHPPWSLGAASPRPSGALGIGKCGAADASRFFA